MKRRIYFKIAMLPGSEKCRWKRTKVHLLVVTVLKSVTCLLFSYIEISEISGRSKALIGVLSELASQPGSESTSELVQTLRLGVSDRVFYSDWYLLSLLISPCN
jgi:hypothetical protein